MQLDPAKTDTLPILWRTKLRSTEHDDWSAQVAHCTEGGLVGIGWRIDELPSGTSLDVVVQTIEDDPKPGWGRQAAQTVRRFGREAKVGDFVWTRDTAGRYWLGKIAGPYSYDNSDAAKAVDVHQVRATDWAPKSLNDLDVPGAVIRGFTGRGLSFSRIHDTAARVLTPSLWEELNGRPRAHLTVTQREVLRSHLGPYDVEDLLFVWFQAVKGYVVFPGSKQRDTPVYEWTMIHGQTHRRAIVQIKTGSEPVDLASLADAAKDEIDSFAFSTTATYEGDRARVTEIVDAQALLAFVRDHRHLLPERTRHLFEMATAD